MAAFIGVPINVGLTVMVKLTSVPEQAPTDGVIVTVDVIGIPEGLAALNVGIFPLPLPASPTDVLLLFQLNDVPITAPVKVVEEVDAPLQKSWSGTGTTVGFGITVMVKKAVTPGQPLLDGVISIVELMDVFPVLVVINPGISPEPFIASPISAWLLVHENVVPGIGPDTSVTAVVIPVQNVLLLMGLAVGAELTVMVNVVAVPAHPLAVGVTVILAIPLLMALNAGMFPFPEVAKPMAELLFVQE